MALHQARSASSSACVGASSVRPAPRAAAPRAAAASQSASRRAHSASTIQSSSSAPRCCRQLVVAAAASAQQITTASAAAPVRKADGSPLRVMIAGPPAAGKGTQCQKIVEKFGLVHISAGDLLRAEVAAGTPAGAQAKKHMDAGQLVPNSVVVDMVKSRLAQNDAVENGWLLDGYPRSAEQAEAIAAAGVEPDLFLLVDVPDDDLVERVTGRRLDPVTGEIYHLKFRPPPADDPEVAARLTQRSDDNEEALRARLATHHSNVAAVVGYYEQVMVKVDGSGKVDEVFETIDGAMKACAARSGGAEAAAA